jgi:hypothetical protein
LELTRDGATLYRSALSESELELLSDLFELQFSTAGAGARVVGAVASLRLLAPDGTISHLATAALGSGTRAMRAVQMRARRNR